MVQQLLVEVGVIELHQVGGAEGGGEGLVGEGGHLLPHHVEHQLDDRRVEGGIVGPEEVEDAARPVLLQLAPAGENGGGDGDGDGD